MTLKVKQLLLISFCSIITLLLFFFGSTKTPIKKNNTEVSKAVVEQQEADFKQIESIAENTLNKDQKDSLTVLRSALEKAKDKQNKLVSTRELAEAWLSFGNPDMNAYYTYRTALLSGTQTDYAESLHKMDVAIQLSPDSLAKAYFVDKSIALYSTLEEKFPDSLSYSIKKANLLIDKKQQVMQGVLILRDVIEKDSLNLQANFVLGKLSVVSGQHDKAVKRLKTVLSQEANNTEALYFLGEAYLGLGLKQEAVATFKKCRELVDNPMFRQEIDKYINSINKQ